MATATIQARSRRFAISSRQVKETVPPSGLPQQASIVGRSMPNYEEQEWLAILARLALVEYIGSGSLASGQVVHRTCGSGAVLSGDIVSGQLGSLHLSSGWVQTYQLANALVVSGSIDSKQGFFDTGTSAVPVGSVILEGQNLIPFHMVRFLETRAQAYTVCRTTAPPSTQDYPIADFYKPVKYNWSESTYEVDQALKKYSEQFYADH